MAKKKKKSKTGGESAHDSESARDSGAPEENAGEAEQDAKAVEPVSEAPPVTSVAVSTAMDSLMEDGKTEVGAPALANSVPDGNPEPAGVHDEETPKIALDRDDATIIVQTGVRVEAELVAKEIEPPGLSQEHVAAEITQPATAAVLNMLTPGSAESRAVDNGKIEINSAAEEKVLVVGSDTAREKVEPMGPILEMEVSQGGQSPTKVAYPEEKKRCPETPPVDIKELTIRNLDTGEEYVIGENDPDFEFDTFALDGGPEADGATATDESSAQTEDWLDKLFNWIFKKTSNKGSDSPAGEGKSDGKGRTPYTKLSSFKFRRELGKGAFGRVLLAESKIDGQLYALKIISKANMRTSDKRQAKAERDILHAMSHQNPHPFTTGLKFAFQSVNNLYIGMEYLPGGNLRQLIQKFGSLPEEWVRFYSAELVLAISHLHALHVIYRDIKPHNIMIDARGHLILIDYGLSKQEVSHPRGAQSLVGTPDYSAPEVLKTGVYRIENAEREKKGKKKKSPPPDGSSMGYGKAADWWSVGVMIYEMLAGTPPFRGPDLRQTYQNVLFAELKFNPIDKFSEPATVLLRGMIQRDPSLRWGAWSNPPTDIMESEFFFGIEWDSILEKRADGPWIPPEEPLVAARRKKEMAAERKRIDEEDDDTLEGWEEDCNSNAGPLGIVPKVTRVNPRKPQPTVEASCMDQSELLNIRESIFDASGVQNANKIPDWSFVDSSALPPSDNGKKKSSTGSKKNLNKL